VKVSYHALYNINNVTPQMVEDYLDRVRKAMANF